MKNKIYRDNDGYIHLPLGNGKHILYHRFLMEQHLGRELAKDEVVHHINHDKQDNRIENLQLMKIGEHSKYHRQKENNNFKNSQKFLAFKRWLETNKPDSEWGTQKDTTRSYD